MSGIDYQALIRFAQALVRVPSVNLLSHGLGEGPVAALVAAQMRSFGWSPRLEEAAPERPNVIALVEGGLPGPTLMFEGHTDVVTEGDSSAWSYDPFGGEVVDGRLYGRGAADMKGGLAAMLFAAAALAAEGPFPGRLLLAALADEEGMMLGVKDFVARGHAAGVAAAIVCEPEGGEV
jgi:succinyl-diaminopimelate desuccinylase